MHGRIVSYSPSSQTGILSDGKLQYRFAGSEWLGAGGPLAGQTVEFSLIGNSAVAIRPAGAGARAGAGGGFVGGQSGGDPVQGMMQAGMQAVRGAANPFGTSSYDNQGPGFWHFYFSPNGRVSLGQYWGKYLLPFGFLAIAALGAVAYCAWLAWHQQLEMKWVLLALGLLLLKFTVVGWISFVMHVKRYHDLNMSWGSAFIVDNFMPYGRDWMAFRVLCQQGTQGPNQFGADPRQLR